MERAIAIFATLGIILSFSFFLSPLLAIIRSIKEKKLDNIPLFFLFAGFLNSFLWVGYGLRCGVKPVLIPNAPNVVLQTFYLAVFFRIHKHELPKLKWFLLALVFTSLLLFFGSVQTIGVFAMLVNMATFASLVEKLVAVLKTRDPNQMNILVVSIATLNGVCWLLFSILIKDPWIFLPNVIGLLTGGVQIYAYFWARKSIEKSSWMIPALKKILRVS